MAKRGPTPIDPKVRFDRFFDRTENSCWEWKGSRFGSGYGQFFAGYAEDGRRLNIHAHRFAYELNFGPIPEGHYILHRCDNPPCVNPEHLFLGTQTDNVHDMFAKGRARPKGRVPSASITAAYFGRKCS